ncbi:MAG TPA: SLC13 family permease [Gammaproteobacteria bacterium]|nr:SLC13 family permease [Gammaproteobacteria bacterium]
MGWEAWLTLAVIGACLWALATGRLAPDVILVGGVMVLLLAKVITPAQALGGLANEGMVTVGLLYIVAAGLQETGAVQWVVGSLFGRPRSLGHAQLRLMVPVAAMSAFLNNTPVVAMMIPAVRDWAKKYQISPSKLMMPLSYAAIVGGACTLIGTSTNLVINGLWTAHHGPSLGLFEIAWVGVPGVFLVIAMVLWLGRWFLPERQSAISKLDNARNYIVEMIVEPGSPLRGKSIEQAGLRHLPGMYLIEIERQGHSLPAVSPQERLAEHDRLIFAGVVESVVDLHKFRGLAPATDQVFKLNSPRSERCLVEAVVSDSCPLVGKTIREGRFRTVYNAAVIAVARNGERVQQKIGDIELRPGDTLLLEANPGFVARQRNSRDFFLVSQVEDSTPPRHDKARTALAILCAMVTAAAAGWLSMLEAAMVAAGLMVASKCIGLATARRAVDWQVLIVIAASFGLGAAMEATGAAAAIARQVIALAAGEPWLTLALTFVIAAVFTALVTNNAAAVLMFPIVLQAADSLGVSPLPFVITLMVAASASFATPIGYQTNLMVYGPGGYRFSDYFKMGIPITVATGLLTLLIAPWIWPF